MGTEVDVNFCAVQPGDEFELIDAQAFAGRLELGADERHARMLTPPAYYSLANGIADNRAINDALLAACAGRPGCRAIGVAELKYGAAAEGEIERLGGLGAAGVVWSPRAQGVFGNDRSLADLCAHAAKHDLVSLVRSAPYSINEGLWRLWALAAQIREVPLLITGALESWENIQLIREHRGGGDNLFYDLSHLGESWDLDALVASIGADRLLFGSGGADLVERTLGIVARSGITEAAKEAILSGNAARLFARSGVAA